ncbi:MAG TPA: MFS transporter [Jatrophihabitans sp.]|nr:MFS transporter [Jatrophihabitans sp.]
MRTYRELFAVAEFRALFGSMSLRYAGATTTGIALGTLVYVRSGSPLLSALSMFGPSAAQVLGAACLLSFADRVRPRATIVAVALGFAATTLSLALPGLPVGALLAIVFTSGLVAAFGGGVQWGLLNEIVPSDGYVLARSVFTMANGVMQMAGFGLGGLLVISTSPRATLVIAAALNAAAAVLARLGLRERRPRATGRGSLRQTWRGNRLLWTSRRRRCLYLAMWVPNGLIVGCEALFIPYSTRWAGLLLSASALGMLCGDLLAARLLSPAGRRRLIGPLRLLLAAPYLLFALAMPLGVAVALVGIASIGYGATLLLQEQLLASTPPELSGHALGLQSSGMLTMQAVGAATAGIIAKHLSINWAITCLALASTLVTVTLTAGLRSSESNTGRHAELRREPEPSLG